jgi:hypothetical protein
MLVIKGLFAIIYGSMWVHYLRKFRRGQHPTETSTKPRPLMCRDVEPFLRSILLVIAWFSVIFGGVACVVNVMHLCNDSFRSHGVVLVAAHAVLLLVYVYQIQFLRHVAASDTPVVSSTTTVGTHANSTRSNCQSIASEQQEVAWAYGWIVLLFGILYVLMGFTWPAPRLVPQQRR